MYERMRCAFALQMHTRVCVCVLVCVCSDLGAKAAAGAASKKQGVACMCERMGCVFAWV